MFTKLEERVNLFSSTATTAQPNETMTKKQEADLKRTVKALNKRHTEQTEALIPELIALAPNLSADKLREHAKTIGLSSLYDLRNSLNQNNKLIASLS